jgi:hypothetical protein
MDDALSAGPESANEPRRKAGFLDRFFRSAPAPSLDLIEPKLWTVTATEWSALDDSYRTAVLEQYKVYAEMADRISARRGQANTFFLTLNTTIFTVLGVFWQHPPSAARSFLVVPWLVLVGQCLAWFWLLRSYRQLNTAKYAVLGAIERRLPSSPYWSAEWTALGQGHDPARYWPLSHIEQWIPGFFAAAYTAGFLIVLFT